MPKMSEVNMVFQEYADIVKNSNIAPLRYKLILHSPRIAQRAKPGQFVHIRISSENQVLLRRPFSVHRIRKGKAGLEFIEIIYEVVGRGTRLLSEKNPKDKLDIIGPLGRGFDLMRYDMRYAILVAGGMGVAPLMFLVERLLCSPQRRVRRVHRDILVLIGSRTKASLMCTGDFRRLGCKVKVATDDGSAGFKGKITELLKRELLTIGHKPSAIYACGPSAMLKTVTGISEKYNIPSQISLEQFMGCGLGACMGCVINTKGGYKRVCCEGPVFDGQDIVWSDVKGW